MTYRLYSTDKTAVLNLNIWKLKVWNLKVEIWKFEIWNFGKLKVWNLKDWSLIHRNLKVWNFGSLMFEIWNYIWRECQWTTGSHWELYDIIFFGMFGLNPI